MRPIKKNSTDQSVVIRIIDSSDGTPEPGVEHNTAGIDLWYRREGAIKTSITEAALAALDSAHSDGGIEHIGDGYYRLDLPDAAVATGANGVMVGGTVTGMIVIGVYIPLVDYDPYDTIRMGLTALPNAAADAAGGVPISDAGGLDLDTKLANTNEVTVARMGALTDWINGGRLDLLIDAVKAKTDNLPADPADDSDIDAQLATIAGYLDTEIAAILAAVDTEVAAIKAKTDNLPADPASETNVDANETKIDTIDTVVDAIKVVTDILNGLIEDVTGNRFTEKALEQAPSGTGASASAIADAVLDEALSEHVAAGSLGKKVGDQANPPSQTLDDYKATGFSTHDAAAVKTAIETAGSHLALIKAQTDDLADGERLDLLIDAIKAITDNLPDSGALSSLATAAALTTVDTVVDAIKAKTENLPADPADDSDIDAQLATIAGYLDTEIAAILAAVDTEVAAIKIKTDNLPSGIAKNVALSNFEFLMIDSTDHVSVKTGLTVTAQISKDGGTFTSCTNSASEIGSGLYKIDLTQAEVNADIITLKFTATGADQRTITITTS